MIQAPNDLWTLQEAIKICIFGKTLITYYHLCQVVSFCDTMQPLRKVQPLSFVHQLATNRLNLTQCTITYHKFSEKWGGEGGRILLPFSQRLETSYKGSVWWGFCSNRWKKTKIFRLFCMHIHIQSTHNALNGTKVIRNESLQLSRYKKTHFVAFVYIHIHTCSTHNSINGQQELSPV